VELIRSVAERVWEAVERAHVEEALKEREQRLSLALDASKAGVWSWDLLNNQSHWDDRFHTQYGFAPGTLQTFETWVSSVHEEDRPRVLSPLDDLINGRETEWNVTFRAVKPDGTVVWMRGLGRSERGPDGQISRMNGINLDITEQYRAEEALRAQRDEERDRTVQLLLETAPLGILSLDSQGVIISANRALETMFGWSPGELIGYSVQSLLVSPISKRQADHVSYPAPASVLLMESDLGEMGRHKDGSTFPIEVSLNHVDTHEGRTHHRIRDRYHRSQAR
jgi:PAS domain S-box-containing protein